MRRLSNDIKSKVKEQIPEGPRGPVEQCWLAVPVLPGSPRIHLDRKCLDLDSNCFLPSCLCIAALPFRLPPSAPQLRASDPFRGERRRLTSFSAACPAHSANSHQCGTESESKDVSQGKHGGKGKGITTIQCRCSQWQALTDASSVVSSLPTLNVHPQKVSVPQRKCVQ